MGPCPVTGRGPCDEGCGPDHPPAIASQLRARCGEGHFKFLLVEPFR